jgi:hypothetical protein
MENLKQLFPPLDSCTTCESDYSDYTRLPLHKLSHLKEDHNRFYAVAVLENRQGRLRLATVEWPKVPFSQWWHAAKGEISASLIEPSRTYAVPAFTDTYCDGWIATAAPPRARRGHTSVWTGSEMIVWGGNAFNYLDTGGRYFPATNNWMPTNTIAAPSARSLHTAVWTGSEMIVWGGEDLYNHYNNGGRYEPLGDTWGYILRSLLLLQM